MPKGKSIYVARYPVLLGLLAELRKGAGLTQLELAAACKWSQPYVSSVERGVLRLDTFQLWDWVHACGWDLEVFGRELEVRLSAFSAASARKRAVRPCPAKPRSRKGQ